MTVALFGTGPMAFEYSKVLDHIGAEYEILGNTHDSCNKFKTAYKRNAIANGIDYLQRNIKSYERVIIAIPVEKQFELVKQLLNLGINNILVEKPGFLHDHEFIQIEHLRKRKDAAVFVAYNRRYYSTIEEMSARIAKEGGIQSCFFEFTELTDKIKVLNKPEEVLSNWLLCNSTHVIDLFLHLCGAPEIWNSYTSGTSPLNGPAIFGGSGITKKEILFSYIANWNSAGSWRLEVSSECAKYILAPLEKLKVQKRNEFTIEDIEIDSHSDLNLKAGLLKMVNAFLDNRTGKLCSLSHQIENLKFYRALSG